MASSADKRLVGWRRIVAEYSKKPKEIAESKTLSPKATEVKQAEKKQIIHIAIPTSSDMLMDERINLGMMNVAFIQGIYTENLDEGVELPASSYSKRREIHKLQKDIRWGSSSLRNNPTLADTVPFQEIYASEGSFSISRMIVLWPYKSKMVYGGLVDEVDRVAIHDFKTWNFAPNLMQHILDRMPSYPLYDAMTKGKQEFVDRVSDKKLARHLLAATWLINKPPESLPLHVYKLWYERGAMIILERSSTFTGRELGKPSKVMKE